MKVPPKSDWSCRALPQPPALAVTGVLIEMRTVEVPTPAPVGTETGMLAELPDVTAPPGAVIVVVVVALPLKADRAAEVSAVLDTARVPRSVVPVAASVTGWAMTTRSPGTSASEVSVVLMTRHST